MGWERVFVLSGVFPSFKAVLWCLVLAGSAGGSWGGRWLGEEPCGAAQLRQSLLKKEGCNSSTCSSRSAEAFLGLAGLRELVELAHVERWTRC